MLSYGVKKPFALFIAMFVQWTVHSAFQNIFFPCEVSNSACKVSYITLNSFHLKTPPHVRHHIDKVHIYIHGTVHNRMASATELLYPVPNIKYTGTRFII